MLKNDLVQTIRDWQGSGSGREKLADRIISLLNQQVQEAGWVVWVPDIHWKVNSVGCYRSAIYEDLMSGKAVRR